MIVDVCQVVGWPLPPLDGAMAQPVVQPSTQQQADVCCGLFEMVVPVQGR